MSHVLIVDDEPDVLELTRIHLEDSGYVVLTAGSGVEAFKVLEEEDVDLVLLDVVMPGMSGLDFFRRLKRSEVYCGLPVVLFTALGVDVDMMLEDEYKAEGYLRKPFTRGQLLEKVEEYIRKR